MMIVDVSDGKSVGLMMMWKRGIKVTELSVTNQHVDVLIENGQKWRLTGVYGEPSWVTKIELELIFETCMLYLICFG
jgi:hypothetical protein